MSGDSFERGWIGVDFDGTLAFYGAWNPEHPLGRPIEPMLERVKLWLSQGRDVRIVTARAAEEGQTELIEAWCLEHVGQKLPVTDRKDFKMAELWDDRAVRVQRNHGHRCCGDETMSVLTEYISTRDVYEAATKPPNSHAMPIVLPHGDPRLIRYREARAKLNALLRGERL